jgi:hypothetical protein
MTLFFILFLFSEEPETVSLDELSIVKIGRVLSHRGHTLILYRGGYSMSETLAIYDHEEGKTRVIDGGPVKIHSGSPVQAEQGFWVLDNITGKIFLIDFRGKPLRTLQLTSLENWPQNVISPSVWPLDDGVAWITLDRLDRGTRVLLEVDFPANTSRLLHEEQFEPFARWHWLLWKDQALAYRRETAEVRLVSRDDFSTIKVLRRGEEPVAFDANRYRVLSRKRKYMTMLTLPIGVGDDLSFLYMDAYDPFGNPHPEAHHKALTWRDGKTWEVSGGYLIGAWDGEYLLYDRDLGEIVLQKQSAKRR